MRQHSLGVRCTRFAGVVVLLTLAVAPPASAANKPYSLVISPATVTGGTTVTMTATFTNETAHQRLGAANLMPPTHFQVTSASVPPPGTARLASSCTVGTLIGPCVQLRNLALPPGQSVTVTMSVNTSAATCGSPTSYTWSVQAKQANNFNGVGNDLDLDANRSSLTTTVSCTATSTCPRGGSCSISLSTSTSTLEVTAGPSNEAGTLTAAAESSQQLVCSVPGTTRAYIARDPNMYSVFESTSTRAKAITYTIKNVSPNGVEFCFGAPYPFETLGDQPAPPGTLPDGSHGFIGLLERCESFPEPPEACVQSIVANGPNTVVTVRIDAGLDGDPWGHG